MKPDLVTLKQRMLDAEQEYLMWAATNAAGPVERLVAIDAAYQKARQKYVEAINAYQTAAAEDTK